MLSAVILIGLAVFYVFGERSFSWRNPVYIALVGPLSGSDQRYGQAMRKAVTLYLNAIKHTVAGKRVKLLMYDDASDPQIAAQIARQIAREQRVLLVIGHYDSGTTLAAGPIYQHAEIPAITASATTEAITAANPWYFRVVPNNAFLGEFCASYLHDVLQESAASIVFLDNAYGVSLVQNFQHTAQRLGMEIRQTWAVHAGDTQMTARFQGIARDIARVGDPGVLFLAIYTADTAKLLHELHASGQTLRIMKPELSFPELPDALCAQGDAPAIANGVYSTSLFVQELGNHHAHQFVRQFGQTSHEKLMWEHATYYDAIQVGIQAIQRADIQGAGHRLSDREQVRQQLAAMRSSQTGVAGVTGTLYFDAQRNLKIPPAVTVVADDMLLPAFSQYEPVADPAQIANLFEEAMQGNVIAVDNTILKKIRVISVGMQVSAIYDIDLIQSRYRADLLVWFRFEGTVATQAFEFLNANSPIVLGSPILEESEDGVTTRAYAVHAEFQHVFDFQRYPFDEQTLTLSLRHPTQIRAELILVPDAAGLPLALHERVGAAAETRLPAGWTIQNISSSQNMLTHVSTLGNPANFERPQTLNYSCFQQAIQIKRANWLLMLREILPLLLITSLIGAIFWLAPHRLGARVFLIGLTLLGTLADHAHFVMRFPVEYLTVIEGVILAEYSLLIAAFVVTASSFAWYQRQLRLIRQIPLFAALTEAQQAALSQIVRRRRIKQPRQIIFRAGEPGAALFILVDGEIRFLRQDATPPPVEITRLQTGGCFGEIALLLDEPRSLTAESVTPCLLGEITRNDLFPLLQQHPGMLAVITAELMRRKQDDLERAAHTSQAAQDTQLQAYRQRIRDVCAATPERRAKPRPAA